MVLETGDPFDNTYRVVWPDGSVHWLHSYGVPVLGHDGTPERIVGTTREITEPKQVAEALHASEAQFQLIADKLRVGTAVQVGTSTEYPDDCARTEFLANMSHELRTPLNAIIGFSDILKNEVFGPLVNEKYFEYIWYIYGSGISLLDAVIAFIDISELELTKVRLKEDWTEIRSLIQACIVKLNAIAREKSIHVVKEIPPSIPKTLFCDPRRIKQILENIIINALRYSHSEGVVTIRVSVLDQGQIVFSVLDAGIGMDAELIDRALRPFGVTGNSMARTGGGIGVGLTISKRLADLHGAHLSVESVPGRGTSVSVTFPRERTGDRKTLT